MKKLVLSITLVFILHKNYNVQYYSKSLRFAFRLFIFFVPVPPAKSRIDGEWLKDVGPSFSSTASLVDEDSGAVYHGGGCAKLSESNPLAVLSNDGGLVRYTNNNLLIYIYNKIKCMYITNALVGAHVACVKNSSIPRSSSAAYKIIIINT